MKGKEIHSHTYKNIIFSFLLLIVLFSTVNSIIAYSFNKSYERQTYDDSRIILSRIAKQIDENIMKQASSLYADLTTNPTLYPDTIDFLHDRQFDSLSYYHLYISLRAALSREPGRFSSITLYNRTTGTVVSSLAGVKWMSLCREEEKPDWMQIALNSSERMFWKYTEAGNKKNGDFSPASIALYAIYPCNTSQTGCSGIVRIEINPDALGEILEEYQTQHSTYYLLDKNGNLVNDRYGNSACMAPLFGDQLDYASKNDYTGSCSLNGNESVILSQPYQQDYILVGILSLHSFYEKTDALRNRIYLILLCVFFCALLLAAVLSDRLYQPLRQLIESAKNDYGITISEADPTDEYAYIKATMDKLFSKASSLESLLAKNYPLIQNAFLISLLQGPPPDKNAIQDKLDFLGIRVFHPGFCVIRLHIPTGSFDRMNMAQKELVLYGLLSSYRKYQHDDITLEGTKTAKDTLTLIANLTDGAWEKRDQWIKELRVMCIQYCGIHPQICVSKCVDSISRVSEANAEAAAIEPYCYFLTQYDYLSTERVPALQSGKTEAMPIRLLDTFCNHLQKISPHEVQRDVEAIVGCCKSGKYSASQCRQFLLSMQYTSSRFLWSRKARKEDSYSRNSCADLLGCDNIDEFSRQFSSLVLDGLALNANEKCSAQMSRIAEYVNSHLAEPISLESLAETFSLSAGYLSKRFSEETGVNYTDFVNNAKLFHAAEQLLNTDKHIDAIAAENGFNSSAYFIKKFRQKYGMTPKKYRIDAAFCRNGQEVPQ